MRLCECGHGNEAHPCTEVGCKMCAGFSETILTREFTRADRDELMTQLNSAQIEARNYMDRVRAIERKLSRAAARLARAERERDEAQAHAEYAALLIERLVRNSPEVMAQIRREMHIE